MQITIQRT